MQRRKFLKLAGATGVALALPRAGLAQQSGEFGSPELIAAAKK